MRRKAKPRNKSKKGPSIIERIIYINVSRLDIRFYEALATKTSWDCHVEWCENPKCSCWFDTQHTPPLTTATICPIEEGFRRNMDLQLSPHSCYTHCCVVISPMHRYDALMYLRGRICLADWMFRDLVNRVGTFFSRFHDKKDWISLVALLWTETGIHIINVTGYGSWDSSRRNRNTFLLNLP